MCVSLPAQVISLKPGTALVTNGTARFEVGRQLLPEARPGDWVLINAGQIVGLISPEEAETIRELLREVIELGLETISQTDDPKPSSRATHVKEGER